MEWIRRAADYRVLIGKRDSLGFPLGDLELARLAELERFFTHDANRRRLPWTHREQVRAPIAVIVQFADALGEARDISGDGVFIATSEPLAPGTRTVVRISESAHPDDGSDGDEVDAVDEWQFGAEVVRVERGGMGLRFVGIPLRLRITHRSFPSPLRHAA
jgi:hypothetical protein